MDLHRPPGPLTKPLSVAARAVRRRGHRRGRGGVRRLPAARAIRPARPVRRAARAVLGHGGAQGPAAAHHQRLDDVGVVRGRFRVAAARSARTRRCSSPRPARFSQCHLNTRTRTPLHRTLFSMASLVVAVEGAGLAFRLLGGGPVTRIRCALARPLVGAATVYFLLNTGARRDGDRAVDRRTHHRARGGTNFLWSAPSYFVGAGSGGARRRG